MKLVICEENNEKLPVNRKFMRVISDQCVILLKYLFKKKSIIYLYYCQNIIKLIFIRFYSDNV